MWNPLRFLCRSTDSVSVTRLTNAALTLSKLGFGYLDGAWVPCTSEAKDFVAPTQKKPERPSSTTEGISPKPAAAHSETDPLDPAAPSSESEAHRWWRLSSRLIMAAQIGIRIEQENGHRWIYEDPNADHCKRLFCTHTESTDVWIEKHYGSVSSALDLIDLHLVARGERDLMTQFRVSYLHFDDLGVIFGDGVQ